MSWLARMEVDRDAARTLSVFDSYAWHRMLWDCYPGVPDAKRDFLTRIDPLEGAFRIWLMGRRKPERPQWCAPEGFALKEVAPSFLSHRCYAFDLRANPTKCLVQRGENGVRSRHGKRVPLVDKDELRAWLGRKGDAGGFSIMDTRPLEVGPVVENHFRKRGIAGCHGGVQFRGTLEVTDQAAFVETYHSGVGGAKGFGFGLLLLAPVNL